MTGMTDDCVCVCVHRRCIMCALVIVPLSSVCVPVQWVVAEQSCNSYSRIAVPLSDNLREAFSYIINLG